MTGTHLKARDRFQKSAAIFSVMSVSRDAERGSCKRSWVRCYIRWGMLACCLRGAGRGTGRFGGGGGGGVEMKEEKNKKKAEREHGARMHFG